MRLAVVLLLAALAGCSSVPKHVLWYDFGAPGNPKWEPSPPTSLEQCLLNLGKWYHLKSAGVMMPTDGKCLPEGKSP